MSFFSKINRRVLLGFTNIPKLLTKQNTINFITRHKIFTGLAGSIIVTYGISRSVPYPTPVFAKDLDDKKEQKRQAMQTAREMRFLTFGSVEYQGNIFMTPLDFLESCTEEQPRVRVGRKQLTDDEVYKMLKKTPSSNRGSHHLFRNLDINGLISYTEYLFLLCVLTKPKSGFQIAFNMFDTDGNQQVDKQEFLVLEELLTNKENSLEEYSTKTGSHGKEGADTTLSVHFFGKKGQSTLKYEDFHRFMDNLQSEVLELEFMEFSRGLEKISEDEFAKILLRYTTLSKEDYEVYLTRLQARIDHTKGIGFKEFKEFGQFLNNLDDFALAMKMYSFLEQPITEEEFKRATKAVTGISLNDHLVHVVFQLFDSDGDGHLSQEEFISVMKDRLHRGFRAQVFSVGNWDIFKTCIKGEMKKKQ